jgi:hypothetical protein
MSSRPKRTHPVAIRFSVVGRRQGEPHCEVFLFPSAAGASAADWVVVDLSEPSWPVPVGQMTGELARLGAAGRRTVAEAPDAVLLRRNPAGG